MPGQECGGGEGASPEWEKLAALLDEGHGALPQGTGCGGGLRCYRSGPCWRVYPERALSRWFSPPAGGEVASP